MSTEKEINDAIAIVQEAAREGRSQYRNPMVSKTSWLQSEYIHHNEYRAKPDPVERWLVVPDLVFNDQDELSFWTESEARKFAERWQFPSRIAHVREVQE